MSACRCRLDLKYPPSSDGGIRDAGVSVGRLDLKYPPSSDGGITDVSPLNRTCHGRALAADLTGEVLIK